MPFSLSLLPIICVFVLVNVQVIIFVCSNYAICWLFLYLQSLSPFYNDFSHCINTKNNIRTRNKVFSKLKDLVSPSFSVCSKKKFARLLSIDILMIGVMSFNSFIERAFETKDFQILSFFIRNMKKILFPRSITDPVKKLPLQYHEFFNVFSWTDSEKLPPHHFYNHKIPLMERKILSWRRLYNMSQNTLKCLKKYIKEYLDWGFMKASSSLTTSLVFFLHMPRDGLQFCVQHW